MVSFSNIFQNFSYLDIHENRDLIYRDAMGFAQFDAKCMKCEHRSFNEPASPAGINRLVLISDNCFALSHDNTREKSDLGCYIDPALHFLPK